MMHHTHSRTVAFPLAQPLSKHSLQRKSSWCRWVRPLMVPRSRSRQRDLRFCQTVLGVACQAVREAMGSGSTPWREKPPMRDQGMIQRTTLATFTQIVVAMVVLLCGIGTASAAANPLQPATPAPSPAVAAPHVGGETVVTDAAGRVHHRLVRVTPAQRLAAARRYRAARAAALAKSATQRTGVKRNLSSVGTLGGQPMAPGALPPKTVPHYFGPYANWANSPLPRGGVATITVDAGGTGYTAPTVAIGDVYDTLTGGPVATGATATATVDCHRCNRQHHGHQRGQ